MMITKEVAESLGHRRELHHVSAKDSRGNPVRCRVNGKCKVWARQPEKFRLPVKYGLKFCFYIDNSNAADWTVA